MVNLNSLLILLSVVATLVESRALKEAIHERMSDEEVEKVFGTSRREVPDYDITHPVQLDHRGKFLSHDVSHSSDNIKAKRNLYLQFPAFDTTFHLKVTSNTDKLLAQGFMTEIRNNGRSRFEKSVDDCHYVGHVITPNGPGAEVALSNCDGLTGAIKDKRGILMISPLPNRLGLGKRAHVVYQRSHGDIRKIPQQLGLDVLRSAPILDENKSFDEESDLIFDQSVKYTIEAMVVTDKNMVAFHGSAQKVGRYVLSLINVVHSLLKDGSIGADIVYTLKRLMILETDEYGLTINSHAENTLSSFCKWTKGQNSDDSSDTHFDNAALITRTALCAKTYDPNSPDCATLLGLADLGGMCGTDTSCVLSTDTGLGTAFTIAHETGHNLGAEHDGDAGNICSDGVNIMARKASGKATGFEWSSCSSNYIKGYLRGSKSKCLLKNTGAGKPLPTNRPGQDYNLDDQCKIMGKGFTGFCKSQLKTVCTKLWCVKGDQCETINEPAAEGSECGTRMWCRRGLCVPYGSDGPQAIDGGYSAWTAWGTCSHTCGGGVQIRSRTCDSPRPQHGGKPCQGESKEYKYCVTKECPSSVLDPRMTACMSKRNVKFVGNKYYDWVYNKKSPVSANERCTLVCEAPETFGSKQMTVSSFGAVQNGLECIGNGPNGVCINGVCKKLGCDNTIGSTAKADRCGVCQGDGSSCHLVSKVFDKVPDNNDDSPYYQTIAVIPKNARNIVIKEISISQNVLALKTQANKDIFNMGFSISSEPSETFKAVGTLFYYKNAHGLETISAKGPLNEAIKAMFLIDDNSWYTRYKVSYQYTVAGSAPSSRDVPQKRSRDILLDECNTYPCHPPRWSTGRWSECSKGCNDGTLGQQSREVTCVMTSAGEEELLDETDCNGPKPATVRTCGKRPCPAEWITIDTSPCSATCGRGITSMTVICQKIDTKGHRTQVRDEECPGDDKPPTSLSCNTHVPCNA